MALLHIFRVLSLPALALGLGAVSAHAADLPVRPSASDIIKTSKPSDWRPTDPANTLYMDLPTGRVVIELAPDFAPLGTANIKTMVKEHYFDGLAIIRSQDNYVAQWGDPNAETKPKSLGSAKAKVPGEFTVPMSNDKHFVQQKDADGYAPQIGHSNGFPVGRDPKAKSTWLLHCYGMVGVGRDNDTDSGSGSELYAITGHAPRHLDRNITLLGRVISGMPLLTTLPRGSEALGFYGPNEARMPIVSVRLEAEVPEAERSHFEVMRSEAPIYEQVLEAQRNRGGPWNKYAANYLEVCNAMIPVRERPKQ
ncbi:peptidylprolyl isomerase [Pseudoduganella sp. FT25W]|uniref:peptidylprolyl isomerase n=1 Tax=Duganella alba TaxID=2666081 RepID=A0A6L5QL49_9BURK|nr:peptidylprolyl isomerase [Duganella alba]MRX10012.1 peptidylprolyl isomerase [Duganella alba]MRX17793.1 peptidylprolyl isomerase [Duganella alba]